MDSVETAVAQRELEKHVDRELGNHTERALILAGLLRTDRTRTTLWTADEVIDHPPTERSYVAERGEESVFTAAQAHGLQVVLGYSLEIGCRPDEFAWLMTPYGELIDPAKVSHHVDAFYGVALRHGEAARWTPTHPTEIIASDLHAAPVSRRE